MNCTQVWFQCKPSKPVISVAIVCFSSIQLFFLGWHKYICYDYRYSIRFEYLWYYIFLKWSGSLTLRLTLDGALLVLQQYIFCDDLWQFVTLCDSLISIVLKRLLTIDQFAISSTNMDFQPHDKVWFKFDPSEPTARPGRYLSKNYRWITTRVSNISTM